MNPIRVHLGQMPPMLRSMINDLLAAESDMSIVGNSEAGEDSLLMARAQNADMLIAQEHPLLEETCLSAVMAATPATILAIGADGHEGASINVVRRQITLDNGENPALADTVRRLLGRR